MGLLEDIIVILFMTVAICIAICQLIDTFRPGDGSPEGYEIDWSRSWTLQTVYKPKPPKVIVVETKHDKKTDTTTSVIIVPPTINVKDLNIKIDNTPPEEREPPETTSGKMEVHRKFHEPNFDDITCREPSYEGMIGHEPNFDIDSYDDVAEVVREVEDVEPNYDSCDGREPNYD